MLVFRLKKLRVSLHDAYRAGYRPYVKTYVPVKVLQLRIGGFVRCVAFRKREKTSKRPRRTFAEFCWIECGRGWSRTARGLRVVLCGREILRMRKAA